MISVFARFKSGVLPGWINGVIHIASGWVEAFGEHLADATLIASDDGEGEVSATTGSDGSYQITPEPYPGWDGTLTPSKPGWIFDPVAPAFDNPDFPTYQNFIATPGGLPRTGQTTSYREGDDGDLERGSGGYLPPTGQTTSYHTGDDGDIQAGIQE